MGLAAKLSVLCRGKIGLDNIRYELKVFLFFFRSCCCCFGEEMSGKKEVIRKEQRNEKKKEIKIPKK